ncbi:LOW QUALITY PROTEIN: cytochrome b-c1 complex subunit 7 [Gastrophryne carolinensis]
MAARAPVAASGRLMNGLYKWYYNVAGFNKLGLMRDDTMYEDDDVIEAVRRLPPKLYDERMFRIKRALDLDMKKTILPKQQWTKYEEDVHYLEPYLKEIFLFPYSVTYFVVVFIEKNYYYFSPLSEEQLSTPPQVSEASGDEATQDDTLFPLLTQTPSVRETSDDEPWLHWW